MRRVASSSAGDRTTDYVSASFSRLSPPSGSAAKRNADVNGDAAAASNLDRREKMRAREERRARPVREKTGERQETSREREGGSEGGLARERVEDGSADRSKKLRAPRAGAVKHAQTASITDEEYAGRAEASLPSRSVSSSRVKDSSCLQAAEAERKQDRAPRPGEAPRMRPTRAGSRSSPACSPRSSGPSSGPSTLASSPSSSSSSRRASARCHVRFSSQSSRPRDDETKATSSSPSSPSSASEKDGASSARSASTEGAREGLPAMQTRSRKSLSPSSASRNGGTARRRPPDAGRLRTEGRASPASTESEAHSRQGDSSPSSLSSPSSAKDVHVTSQTAPGSSQKGRLRDLRSPSRAFKLRRGEKLSPSLSRPRGRLRSERRTDAGRSRRGVSPATAREATTDGAPDGEAELGKPAYAPRQRQPPPSRTGVSTRASASLAVSAGPSPGGDRLGVFSRGSEGGATPPGLSSPFHTETERRSERERAGACPALALRLRHHGSPGQETQGARSGHVSPRGSRTALQEDEGKMLTRRACFGEAGRQRKARMEARDKGVSALSGKSEPRAVGTTPNERSPVRPILSFSPSSPTRKKEGHEDRDGFFGARWRINAQTGLKELDPGPLGVEFHCNVCGVDVSAGQWRVRCAECDDFDLCVFCFAHGRETGTHLNTHAYRPMPPNRQEIFAPNWTADEEQMLLEGVSRFGLGNWNDVASLVNRVALRAKTKQQCEQHYMSVYIDSGGIPTPLWETETAASQKPSPAAAASPSSLIFSPRRDRDASTDKDDVGFPLEKAGPDDAGGKRGLKRAEPSGELGSSGDASATTPDGPETHAPAKKGEEDESDNRDERRGRGDRDQKNTQEESEEAKACGALLAGPDSGDEDADQPTLPELQADSNSWHPPWIAKPVPPQPHHNNIQGYLPLRGDFDVEFDNHAEALLADMAIEAHESPAEKALKLSIVEAYNCRLDERIYRKRTVLWRHWDDPKVANKDKAGTLLERLYWQQLKPVQRFHNDAEHIALVRSLVTYAEAMERCRLLKEWRSLDLRTLQDVTEYEAEKQRRRASCPPAAFRSLFDARRPGPVSLAEDSLKSSSGSPSTAVACEEERECENVRASPTGETPSASTAAEKPGNAPAVPPSLSGDRQAETADGGTKDSSSLSSLLSSPSAAQAEHNSEADPRSHEDMKCDEEAEPETASERDGAGGQGTADDAKATKKREREELSSSTQPHRDELEQSEVDLCKALELPPVLYQLVIQALTAQAHMLPTVEKDRLRKKRKRVSTTGSLWDFDVRLDVEQTGSDPLRGDAPSPTVILSSSPANKAVGALSPFPAAFASSGPPASATDPRTNGVEASSHRDARLPAPATSRASPSPAATGAGDSLAFNGASAPHVASQGPLRDVHAYQGNRHSHQPANGASQKVSRLPASASPSAYAPRNMSPPPTPEFLGPSVSASPTPHVVNAASLAGPDPVRGPGAGSASPHVSRLSQSFLHLQRQGLPTPHPGFASGYTGTTPYPQTLAAGNGSQASSHPVAHYSSSYLASGGSSADAFSAYSLPPSPGPGASPNAFYASRGYYASPSGVAFSPQAQSLRAANAALQRLQQQQLHSFLLASGRGRSTANAGWGAQSGNVLLSNAFAGAGGSGAAGVGGGHDFLFPSAQNVSSLSQVSPYFPGNAPPHLSFYSGRTPGGAGAHGTPTGYAQWGWSAPLAAYHSNPMHSGASPSWQLGGIGPFSGQPKSAYPRDFAAESAGGAPGPGGPQGLGRCPLRMGTGVAQAESSAPPPGSRLFHRESQMGTCQPAWSPGASSVGGQTAESAQSRHHGESVLHASSSEVGGPGPSGQGADRREGHTGGAAEGEAVCGSGARMKEATRGPVGDDAEEEPNADGRASEGFFSGDSPFAPDASGAPHTAAGSGRSFSPRPARTARPDGPGNEGEEGGRKRDRTRSLTEPQGRPREARRGPTQDEGKREEEREKWKAFVLHKLLPRVRGVEYDATSHQWVSHWPSVSPAASPVDRHLSFPGAALPPAAEKPGDGLTRVSASGCEKETEVATQSVAFSVRRLGFEGAWFQACEARRKEAEKAQDWALVAAVRAAEASAPSVFAALQDELPSLPFSSNDLASAFSGLSPATESKASGVFPASLAAGAKKGDGRDEEDRRERRRRLLSASCPVPTAMKASPEAATDVSQLPRSPALLLTHDRSLKSPHTEAFLASSLAGLPRHAGGARTPDLLGLQGPPPNLLQSPDPTRKRQAGLEPVPGEAQSAPQDVLPPGGHSLLLASALASPGIPGATPEHLQRETGVVKAFHGLGAERHASGDGAGAGQVGPWACGGATAVGASLVGHHRRLAAARPGKETPSPGIAAARKAVAADALVYADGSEGRATLLAAGMAPLHGGLKPRDLSHVLAGGQFRAPRGEDTKLAFCNGGASSNSSPASFTSLPPPPTNGGGKPRGGISCSRGGGSAHAQSAPTGRGHNGERRPGASAGTGGEEKNRRLASQPLLAWSDDDDVSGSSASSPACRKGAAASRDLSECSFARDFPESTPAPQEGHSGDISDLSGSLGDAVSRRALAKTERPESASQIPFAEQDESRSPLEGTAVVRFSQAASGRGGSQRLPLGRAAGSRGGSDSDNEGERSKEGRDGEAGRLQVARSEAVRGGREDEDGEQAEGEGDWAREEREAEGLGQRPGVEKRQRHAGEGEVERDVEEARRDALSADGKGRAAFVEAPSTSRETTVSSGVGYPSLSAPGLEDGADESQDESEGRGGTAA
uniref:Myb-like DNA-binding domain-containing protein / Zinc finger, ZZ type domain-containing protein, putative n=1 Tax=Neospora caninum (strain Liverpool) TaxID=572307 RepID=A0A0F7UA17_NEOCL|nr:TPA: myb-like DNA-binding domain-containing protein / Zinc finger, ZZ type domain-containing protein, putative [Neospora caninum Liverpool]